MFVKCANCGNVFGSQQRMAGGICGVMGCNGLLRPFSLPPAVLKCNTCGNAFGSPPRWSGETCGVNQCGGQLGPGRL